MNDLEVKHWIVIIVIILAAILAASISVYQYIESVNKEKKNDSLQNQLIQSQALTLIKADSLEKANKEAKIRANQLIKTQAELNTLQNETLKKVMGFGYAFINIGRISKTEMKFYVQSKSEYPIYETEIVVYDQDQLNLCPKTIQDGKSYIMLSCHNASGREFPTFTLNALKTRPLGYTHNLIEEKHFAIKITSKHNTTYQYSIVKYNSQTNQFIHYYRIFEIPIPGKYILLEKDDNGIQDEIFEKNFTYKKEISVMYD